MYPVGVELCHADRHSDCRPGGRTEMVQLVVVLPTLFFKAPKKISREELPENSIAARSARYLWSPARTAPEAVSWISVFLNL
jgi:hypothetical protein